jgi:hypothetical protein
VIDHALLAPLLALSLGSPRARLSLPSQGEMMQDEIERAGRDESRPYGSGEVADESSSSPERGPMGEQSVIMNFPKNR